MLRKTMVNLQSPVFNVTNTQMELLVNIEVTYLFWGKLKNVVNLYQLHLHP